MKSILLLCIPLSLGILVSCAKTEESDKDYYIQAFGKSYICEYARYYSSGTSLFGCVNVLDNKDIIKEIKGSSNYIEVGDLK